MLVSAVVQNLFNFLGNWQVILGFQINRKNVNIYNDVSDVTWPLDTPRCDWQHPWWPGPTRHHVQSLSIWRREWDSTITYLSPEIAFCTSNLWRFVSGADFIEMSSVVQSRLTMTQDLKHTCSHSSSTSPIWTLYPDCARSYCSLHALVKWLTPVNSFILFPFGLMPPHIH